MSFFDNHNHHKLCFAIVFASLIVVMGSVSIVSAESWSVSSETDWFDNASDSEVDVRTTVSSGQLHLISEDSVAFWSMDDSGSSSNLNDLTSNNNDGDITNASYTTSGKFDDALNFSSGTDHYVNLGSGLQDAGSNNDEITIMGWVNIDQLPSSTGYHADFINQWHNSTNSYLLRIDYSSEKFYFYINDGGSTVTATSDSVPSTNEWIFLVGRAKNGTLELSVNDTWQSDTGSYSSITEGSGGNCFMGNGSASSNNGFFGTMDEFMISDQALSDDMISRIYNRTSPTSMTGSELESGTWTSQIWDSGASSEQQFSSLNLENCSYSSSENIEALIEATDTGENTGWVQLPTSDSDNIIESSDSGVDSVQGENFQVNLRLESSTTTSSPSVDSFELNTKDAGAPPIIENLVSDNIMFYSADLNVDVSDSDGDDIDWAAFINEGTGEVIENIDQKSFNGATQITFPPPEHFETKWEELNPDTTYNWKVKAADTTGAVSTSSVQTFATKRGILTDNLKTFDSTGTETGIFELNEDYTVEFDVTHDMGSSYIKRSYLTLTNPSGTEELTDLEALQFQDQFSDLNDWNVISGTWATGDYVGGSDSELACESSSSYNDFILVDQGTVSNRENVTLTTESRIEYETGDRQELIFRYQDQNNYAGAYWTDKYSVCGIEVVSNGTAYRNEASFFPNVDTWYNMRVTVRGDTATLYINGDKKVQYTNMTFDKGRLGLRANAGWTYFDNFTVGDPRGSIKKNIDNGYRYEFDLTTTNDADKTGTWEILTEGVGTQGTEDNDTKNITISSTDPIIDILKTFDSSDVETSSFKAGETVTFYTEVRDPQGRANLSDVKVTAWNANGTKKVDNVSMTDEGNIINGNKYEHDYTIPKELGSEGEWDYEIYAVDDDTNSTVDDSTFTGNTDEPEIDLTLKNEALETVKEYDIMDNKMVFEADITDPDGGGDISSVTITVENSAGKEVVSSQSMNFISDVDANTKKYRYTYDFTGHKDYYGTWNVSIAASDGTYSPTLSRNYIYGWAFNDYDWRKPVELTEKFGQDRTNEESGLMFSADSDKLVGGNNLRVTDRQGDKLPFEVRENWTSGGKRYVKVNFLENIEANETENYYIYFDDDTSGKTYPNYQKNMNRTWKQEGYKQWYDTNEAGQLTYSKAVDTGDVNEDGENELIVVGQTKAGTKTDRGFIRIYDFSGSSLSLIDSHNWYTDNWTFVYSVKCDDINGDGDVEIITGGAALLDDETNRAQLRVWNYDGDFSVLDSKMWNTGETTIYGVNSSDLDGDGNTNVITVGATDDENTAQVSIFEYSSGTLSLDDRNEWGGLDASGRSAWYSVKTGHVYSGSDNQIIVGGVSYDSSNVLQGTFSTYSFDGSTLTRDHVENWQKGGTVTEFFGLDIGDVDNDGTIETVLSGNWYDGSADVPLFRVYNIDAGSVAFEGWENWTLPDSDRGSALTTIINDSDSDDVCEINTAGFQNDGSKDRGQFRQYMWTGSDAVLEYKDMWEPDVSVRSGDFSDAAVVEDLDEDGVMELADVGRYELSPPAGTYLKVQGIAGISKTTYDVEEQNKITITKVSLSENLVDRDKDRGGGTYSTEVTIRATHNNSWEDIENVFLTVKDNAGSSQISSEQLSYSQIDSTTIEATYTYNPDDSISDSALGEFTVTPKVADKYGFVQRRDNYFTVDDLNTTLAVIPYNYRLGLAHGFKAHIGGVSKSIITKSSVDNVWIDIDQQTEIYQSPHDGHYTLLSMENEWGKIEGDGSVTTDWYTEGNGSWEITLGSYSNKNAHFDYDLTNINKIHFDYDFENTGETTGRIHVDGDALWTINSSGTGDINLDVREYDGKCTIKMYIQTESTGAYFRLDNFAMLENYNRGFKITSQPGEIINVTVQAFDNRGSGLDGSTTTSFEVNDNRFYRLFTRYEENFELFPEDNFTDRNIYAYFHFDSYEEQRKQVVAPKENFTVKHAPRYVRMVFREGTENEYARRYLITEPKENVNTVGVQEEDLNSLSLYTFKLWREDTEAWGPPNGKLGIFLFDENKRFYTQKRYWNSTNDASMWLKFGKDYNLWLKGETTQSKDYGTVEADTVYEKTIYPSRLGTTVSEGSYSESSMQTITYATWEDDYSNLVVDYEDTSGETNWVFVEIINQETGQVEWYDNVDGSSLSPNDFNITYTSTAEYTLYAVNFTINHNTYDIANLTGLGGTYIAENGSVENAVEDVRTGNALSRLGQIEVDGQATSLTQVGVFFFYIIILLSAGPAAAGIGVIVVGMIAILLQLFGIFPLGWPVITIIFVVGIMSIILSGGGRFG